MGRTPVNKSRIDNRSKQLEIANLLSPVFFEQGFSSFSTEDICAIAKKSKATIYKYFSSKGDMISFITSQKLEEIRLFAPKLADETLPYSERYKQAVNVAIESFGGISYQFLKDLKTEFLELFDLLINLKDISITLLRDFYQSGINAGEFRNLNPELLSANDDLFFTAILETDFLSDKTYSIQELFNNYFRARFQGILLSN
ncbi:MAG: TetR/AcrR family transcriptional regulator [Flavobacteriales bacterium]|nr:TetR/AcrR family transcriptional regulator [Flavobacteriales bacterium]